MSSDSYVLSIVNKYKRVEVDISVTVFVYVYLKPLIKNWAGDNLIDDIEYSGSTAKGTATTLGSDVDIFIPLKNKDGNTLEYYFNGLFSALSSYNPRKQNVSIRIEFNGYKIDLVPGRAIDGYKNYFSLYKSKTGTWAQTNISDNIKLIKESGRIDEIVAIKVWRHRHSIDMSSTLLESIVLRALKNHRTDNIANNVFTVLKFIGTELQTVSIVDPSNTNNILTDDLTRAEKGVIVNKAQSSVAAQYWSEIIW